MQPGYRTTEFWMSAIGALTAAVVPLLIAYGVLSTEQGELWAGLILAVSGVVVPIVIGSIVKNYNESRMAIKMTAIEAGIMR